MSDTMGAPPEDSASDASETADGWRILAPGLDWRIFSPEGQPFGAVGVTVDEDGNLREAGRLALDQYSYAGRVLLDDQNLYAVSETGVVAADADSWRRTGSVSFGAPVPGNRGIWWLEA